MFEILSTPEAWIALVTLTTLEIVLGIDNIIFISIVVGKLPAGQRDVARRLGLSVAVFARLGLLFSIAWIMGLVTPWFTIWNQEISGRDLILILGGLFLLAKSTHEIHQSVEHEPGKSDTAAVTAANSMGAILVQIALLDIVFSLDSIITAVGLVDEVFIMATAIIIAVIIMLFAAKPIGDFVDTHPTIKILALAFLILIGITLILEGFDHNVPKGYIYFAIAFSLATEMINIRMRKKLSL